MNDVMALLVLLVGGDAPTRGMARFFLADDGYAVVEAADVAAVHGMEPAEEPALVVAVAGEREGDTLAMLTALRRMLSHTPMLLLAHDVSLNLRRGAFALGVRDVVPLPVVPRDLQARLRAALGERVVRQEAPPHGDGDSVRAGGLLLQVAERAVSDGNGWSVRLTRREAALLRTLMATPGQVVGRQELVERVWGRGSRAGGSANALAVYVRRLRAKLTPRGAAHGYVHTVHGRGYVFEARSSARRAATSGDERRADECMPILLVDDDRATLDMMAEVLRMAGYAVTCGVGPQAPVLARQMLPTLILLDINMPDMNGIEVRRRLRESPHTAMIPVIALSASGNLRRRAGEIEADDYLAKPFSTDELLLRVEKWVGRVPRS